MSEAAAAATAAPIEGTPTAPIAPEQTRARLSDMSDPTARLVLPPLDRPEPAARAPQQQPPEPTEAPELAPLEGQSEETPAPEGDQPAQETPEQLAAKYQELMASPDLDPEVFGDKIIWTKDRQGNPVPMRVADVERHTMLYGDYQFKTRELAAERRQFEQHNAGMQAFQRDLLSGDPQQALKAMRWVGAEKSMHAMVVAYVQRMAQLEGLPPDIRQQFIDGERARDEAEMLRRQVAAREQQERAWREQQAQQQGLEAPDIQHVMGHIQQRLPALMQEAGVVQSDAFDRLLGEQLTRATEGERGPDGKWLTAPIIQRGRTPTDDVLRQIVGAAREELQALIARSGARHPPRSRQLPPPPAAAAVTGPAAKPGTRGNLTEPERLRWSDMGKRR
jgi:hypothetical protein